MARRQKRREQRTRRRFPRRKDETGPCIDYKDVELLRKMLSIDGKILSRKRLGAAADEQRTIKQAIKQARFLALLPFKGG